MSPPRRRSSRLRGSSSYSGKPSNFAARRLSSLLERDESPPPSTGPTIIKAAVAPPLVPRTPTAAGSIRPAFEEMHPGHAHSTLSPSFDFRFAHTPPKLGPDAQRMMDDIREEALRIKAKLAAERDEKRRDAAAEDAGAGEGRRIATPRGKVGRFSDVHMAEFKKMDSIAGHPSAFRAQPGRLAAAPLSLKRSQSKAQLGGREDMARDAKATNQSQAVDNKTPAKRVRMGETHEASRPLPNKPAVPMLSRSQSVLSSITTPTKASLARAASVKRSSQSQIPTMTASPSKNNMTTPRPLAKSATMNNIAGMARTEPTPSIPQTPSRLNRLRAMLRRPAASSDKSSATGAKSIPSSVQAHKSIPSFIQAHKSYLDKELPSIPSTPILKRSDVKPVSFAPATSTPILKRSDVKLVNFAPTTTVKLHDSPSPLRLGRSLLHSSPTAGVVHYPSLPSAVAGDDLSQDVLYPILTSPSLPRPRGPPRVRSIEPSTPGTFTFRSDRTINFGASPRGFGSSPGQASVRHVRSSMVPSAMPGSFPGGSNKENIGGLPAIPHGMPNKKRRRADSDDDDAKEEEQDGCSPTKKHKGARAQISFVADPTPRAEQLAPKSRIPSPAKKGVLSLNRLNMLARPKLRK